MKLPFRSALGADSTNRLIFRAAATIAILSVIATLGVAVKDILVARYFGRSDPLDAFLIAYLVPSFAVTIVMGALAHAFTPIFIEQRHQGGGDAAQKLLSNMILCSTVLMIAIMCLLALLAPFYLPYLAANFSDAKLRLTRELLYFLLPFGVFGGLAAFLSLALNAGERFALAAITPLVTPVITIILLEVAADRWGVFCLVGGVVAGNAVEAAMLFSALKANGMRPSLRWHGFDSAMRKVVGQSLPLLAASFLMSCTTVVDQAMAAMLPAGSVAALSYGNKVVSAILSVGAVALSRATFPYFSKMAAQSDWDGCRHSLKRYSLWVVLSTLPLTVALIFLSEPLTKVLFERGVFSSADTSLVSWVQICYAIQIPFYVGSVLYARFLNSIGRSDVVMYVSAASLTLDILLNLILMRIWGIGGIALATSIIYIFTLICVCTCSLRLLAKRRICPPIFPRWKKARSDFWYPVARNDARNGPV